MRTDQITFRQVLQVAGVAGSGVRLEDRIQLNGRITSVCFHFPLGCFTPKTPILTAGGIKPISEVRKGDEILCHKSQAKVVKTFSRPYDGNILGIKALGLPTIETTPEHPILAIKAAEVNTANGRTLIPGGKLQKRYKKEPVWEPRWIVASELAMRDWIVCPVSTEIEDSNKIDIMSIVQGFQGYEIGGQLRQRYSKRTIPRFVELTPALLRVFGYFLAEGSFFYDCKKYPNNYHPPCHPRGIRFSFGITEGEYVDDVVKTIKNVFGLPTGLQIRTKRNTLELIVNNSIVAKLFKELCGEYAAGKVMHRILMLLPPPKQAHILEGFFRGDGCLYGKRKQLVTISEKLAWQLYMIAHRLKLFPNLETYQGKKHLRYTVTYQQNLINKRKFYKNGWCFSRIQDIVRKPYSGIVHNLEVNPHNSYTAGGISVHNCNALVDITVGHLARQFMPLMGTLALNDATPVFQCDEACKKNEVLWCVMTNGDGVNLHTPSVIVTMEGE